MAAQAKMQACVIVIASPLVSWFSGVETSAVRHPHDTVTAYTARMGEKAKAVVDPLGGFAVFWRTELVRRSRTSIADEMREEHPQLG